MLHRIAIAAGLLLAAGAAPAHAQTPSTAPPPATPGAARKLPALSAQDQAKRLRQQALARALAETDVLAARQAARNSRPASNSLYPGWKITLLCPE